MVEIIVESGQMGQPHSAWLMPEERRFNDGHRHGLNVALRALVELETRIEDSNVLDQLIGDMMEEATAQ